MLKDLEGRIALVTGGAAGIGRAIAEQSAREGACVVIGDIAETGEEVARAITAAGGEAVFQVTDARRAVIDINLIGIWRTMAATLPDMVGKGRGAIVATSSVAGLVGAGGLGAYVASKHGVAGLVKSVAIDVAKSGIRVNAICPGMVATAMVERLAEQVEGFEDALLAFEPMARLGQPPEIAEAAIWLASDRASFVTGHMLAIDGGYAAQ